MEKKINANEFARMGIDPARIKVAGSLFKRENDFIYKHVFSEWLHVSTTQTASEKVVTTVTTFLKEDSNGILLRFSIFDLACTEKP